MQQLPNLAGLDLKPHEAAPTAEFFSLDEDQQQQLVAAGDVEMFSQEVPAVHNGGTFRVAKTQNARAYIMTDYDWYDGRQLWQWAQTHELDPLRKPWWYEDWLALYDVYAEVPGVPGWVNALPQLDPSVPKRVLPPPMVNMSSSQETVWAPNDDPPPSPLRPSNLLGRFDDVDDVPTPLPVVRQPNERAPLPSFTGRDGRRRVHTWERGWIVLSPAAPSSREQLEEEMDMLARRSDNRPPEGWSTPQPPNLGFRSLHDNGYSWP